MLRILHLLRPLLRFSIHHPIYTLLLSLMTAGLSGFYALQLKVDTDIANLLPEHYESVKALEVLKKTVGGEAYLDVVIESPSFEANKMAAEFLIEASMKLRYERKNIPFFTRYEYRKDTEILQDNALYFATHDELENIISFLGDEIEQAKLEANPFFFDLEDEFEEDGEGEKESSDLADLQKSYQQIIPSEYPVNSDSTILVLKFQPSGSKSDLRYLRSMFATYDSLVKANDFSRFHPQMHIAFGGRIQKTLLDIDSIITDVQNSFGTGISAVLLLVMFYFLIKTMRAAHRTKTPRRWHAYVLRAPIPVLVIGLPLLVSLLWTFGIAYMQFGVLNTMTSVLFVILFGMGIDYGIHFYARYIELRANDASVEHAIDSTYETTGAAIMTSAITTAAALFVFIVADFRGFSEFGMISGIGIILAFFSMVFLLPSILVLFERWNWILLDFENKDENQAMIHRYPFARTIVSTGLVVCAFVGFFVNHLWFQYDFTKLEPEYPQYQVFRALVKPTETDDRRNPAYIVLQTREEVEEVLAAIREKIQTDTLSPTILDVEALQERFPEQENEQRKKLESIAQIKILLKDPFLSAKEDNDLDKLRRGSQTTKPISIDEVPDFLKTRFITKQGELGKFVMIYPALGLGDGRNSIAFKDDVAEIITKKGNTYYAGSTSIVAAEMLDLMITESPYMILGTFVLILIFMAFTFRSLRWTIISMLPLVVGLIFTFAIMIVFNIPFNFYNLIVLPAILGIGEDSGVHLAYRYKEEGKGSVWHVLSSTGQHITIGSFTTMLGFAGLLLTHHPGLYSMGLLATIGIGMTWFTSITFLPALIQILEDKNWIRF